MCLCAVPGARSAARAEAGALRVGRVSAVVARAARTCGRERRAPGDRTGLSAPSPAGVRRVRLPLLRRLSPQQLDRLRSSELLVHRQLASGAARLQHAARAPPHSRRRSPPDAASAMAS